MSPKVVASYEIWRNPIFLRYCRSRLRLRGLGVWMLIVILISAFIVGINESIGTRMGIEPATAARNCIIPLLVLQGIILFIIGTAQVAGGMVAERDEGVIDYQRLIPMSPLAKVTGYLFGLPVREYVLVLSTLPFMAWGVWKGGVSWHVWVPIAVAVCSSTLLYHVTALLTGTVVTNRRWAFLVCIGLVFALYTVIPRLADFGLVFFRYLTITPVISEYMPELLPKSTAAAVRAAQRLAPSAKFFNLDFREIVFTVFTQFGLVLTFLVMLCRKWKWAESHLLGRFWAVGFFIWIQVLLLGNALPLIEPGTIFPSRGFSRYVGNFVLGNPAKAEALAMAGIYGLATLGLLWTLTGIITPSKELQQRAWRRAKKQGAHSVPMLSDGGTSFWFAFVMALVGGGGWYIFTKAVVESRWYPGHFVELQTLGVFTLVMLVAGLGFQAMMETRGGRVVGLAAILVGAVPIMIGMIVGGISERFAPLATWLFSVSPASLPFFAAGAELSISELPVEIARAVPRAFHFILFAGSLSVIWLVAGMFSKRRETVRDLANAGKM